MSSNIRFTEEKLLAVDQALDQLESALVNLVALDVAARRRLHKMGRKSEAFCRQAMTLMDQNRQVVPPSLELDEALADLQTLDELRPRKKRVERLAERMADSETVLGSGVAQAARKSYALLKVIGKNQGLETLRSQLAERFRGRRPGSADKLVRKIVTADTVA
jgi:hypothetical protein